MRKILASLERTMDTIVIVAKPICIISAITIIVDGGLDRLSIWWLEATTVRYLLTAMMVSGGICMMYCIATAIYYKTGGRGLNEPIISNHGDNLAAVMEAIRHEHYEYVAIFDTDGHKLVEGTLLSPYQCDIPRAEWSHVRNLARMHLHNHPGFEQTAFSDNDYYNMILCKFQYAVVVTHWFTYTIENPYWNRDDGPSAREVGLYAARLNTVGFLGYGFFPRWYSCIVSYLVARKFGLKFHVEDVRVQKIKAFLRHQLAISHHPLPR